MACCCPCRAFGRNMQNVDGWSYNCCCMAYFVSCLLGVPYCLGAYGRGRMQVKMGGYSAHKGFCTNLCAHLSLCSCSGGCCCCCCCAGVPAIAQESRAATRRLPPKIFKGVWVGPVYLETEEMEEVEVVEQPPIVEKFDTKGRDLIREDPASRARALRLLQ